MDMRRFWKHLSTALLALVLVAGVCLMAYPTAADWWNRRHTARVISDYADAVRGISAEDYTAQLEAARAYNEKLLDGTIDVDDADAVAEYGSLLDIAGNGVMCYVDIPSIGVSMPVYHGTSDSVLQRAVGHLYGTSLPVGGAGTHACLSGHTGLPSARLLTDLTELEQGDRFTVQVLGDVLAYEVDQVKVVLPDETEDLRIVPGKDYCTLVTCTPYGVNSHRLLVRGTRIPDDARDVENAAQEARADSGKAGRPMAAKAAAAACAAVAAAGAATAVHISRRKRGKAE